jgi:hypothetical protein
LMIEINSFVSAVRDARGDMADVNRELSSLSFSLSILQEDAGKVSYPESLEKSLTEVLRNCDRVTTQMKVLLDKLSSMKLGRRIQWAVEGRGEMDKLRSSPEAHKSAIEIALEMGAM